MIEIIRDQARRVKRYSSGEMALRWAAAGMLAAQSQFRCVKGYKQLPEFARALDHATADEPGPLDLSAIIGRKRRATTSAPSSRPASSRLDLLIWLPSQSRVQGAAQEGEDLAARGSGGRYQAGGTEETVGGLRVAGQAGIGAVLAEPFGVPASVVGHRIQRGLRRRGRQGRPRTDSGGGPAPLRRPDAGEAGLWAGGARGRGRLAAGVAGGPGGAVGGARQPRRGVGRGARPRAGRWLHPARLVGHSHTDGPGEPCAAALAGITPRSATVEVGAFQLIEPGRDSHRYCWETVATVPLGLPVGIYHCGKQMV
jgi:hypothetical protein